MDRCQRRWEEMAGATAVMLCSVLMQAYILGTLFHYLVKRDPKLEAFRCAHPCSKPPCKVHGNH